MNNEHPSYYAILPADVRYDKNLKPMEKIMYSEITALSNKDGFCSASNRYFAELYDVDESTVSRWIKRLSDFGYLSIMLVRDDRKAIIGRHIMGGGIDKKINRVLTKKSTPSPQKSQYPIDKKVIVNSTSINTTSINNSARAEKLDFVSIAKQMEAHVQGEGAEQWGAMCEASGYKGKPITVLMNWAGKASEYQLRNWKAEIPKLLTWMRNEARADYVASKKAQAYTPAQPTPANSMRIHRKNRVS